MKTSVEKNPGEARDAVRERAERGSTPSRLSWDWLVFNATVFVASGCIMTVEILSTRLVARFLGSSLYTWTSAIGVVLAGISLGNYLGGRLADRFHPRRTLSLLFIAASLCCLSIPMMNNWIGWWEALNAFSWPTRIFLHFALAFLLPATMLGTMAPVVAKMALSMGQGAGRTIGTLYAWGAIGSIVGTFVAGFFLVAWIGTEGAVLLVAGVLALMGIAYGYRSWVPYAWTAAYAGVMLCALGSWSSTQAVAVAFGLRERDTGDIVFQQDSNYQRVMVRTAVGSPNERRMVLDKLVHSQANLRDPLEMKYHYAMVYAEVMRRWHPANAPVTALVIGGGGYVFPRYLEIAYPGSYVEVAEIDPVVTQAAFEVFGLPRDTSIRRYHMDARNRVQDLVRRKRAGEAVPVFDFIFGDSFSDFSVPFHLTTLEFDLQLNELLSDDGVYMLNMIDLLDSGRFLGAVVNTYRRAFPCVYVFSASGLTEERDTFIVVCAKRYLDLSDVVATIRAKNVFTGDLLTPEQLARLAERSGDVVLTDDYAPVENLLAPVVRRFKASKEEEKTRAEEFIRLIDQGAFERLIARCREVLKDDPDAARAHFYLGVALAKQGRLDEAIAEYRAELQRDPGHATSYANIGLAEAQRGDFEAAVGAYRAALKIDPRDATVRCHLGRALLRLGKPEEAASEYREAIRVRPGYARAHDDLGVLLLQRGEAAAAVTEFREVLKLDSNYPGVRNQLGQALAETGDLAGAAESFGLAVESEPSNADYRMNLGLAFQRLGRATEAAAQYQESLRLKAENPPVMNALAWLLATSAEDRVRDGAEAVRWAERLCQMVGRDNPELLDTLAAAYAEVGRYDEAVQTARRALELASGGQQTELADQIRARLKLYEAGQPYRE